MDISIIIPVYNERVRLPDNLVATMHYLNEAFAKSEVIIVEDGSEITVEDYIKSLPMEKKVEIRHIAYAPNRGKGYAVRRGVMEASGELIAYIDADGSTPIDEMDRLLAAIKNGADIAAGSRALESHDTKVEKTLHRFLIGRVYANIVKMALGINIEDTQCGFKLFRKKAAHEIFGELKTESFAFDIEVLARGLKKGYQISEVAVNWHDVAGSKVRLGVDSLRMLGDVFKIACMIK